MNTEYRLLHVLKANLCLCIQFIWQVGGGWMDPRASTTSCTSVSGDESRWPGSVSGAPKPALLKKMHSPPWRPVWGQTTPMGDALATLPPPASPSRHLTAGGGSYQPCHYSVDDKPWWLCIYIYSASWTRLPHRWCILSASVCCDDSRYAITCHPCVDESVGTCRRLHRAEGNWFQPASCPFYHGDDECCSGCCDRPALWAPAVRGICSLLRRFTQQPVVGSRWGKNRVQHWSKRKLSRSSGRPESARKVIRIRKMWIRMHLRCLQSGLGVSRGFTKTSEGSVQHTE